MVTPAATAIPITARFVIRVPVVRPIRPFVALASAILVVQICAVLAIADMRVIMTLAFAGNPLVSPAATEQHNRRNQNQYG